MSIVPTASHTETSGDIHSTSSIPQSSTPQVGQKRQANTQSSANVKRKRFTPKSGTRHGGTSYSKNVLNPSATIRPVQTVFPIFTSDEGCTVLTEHVHAWLTGKDFRFGNQIPLALIQYAVTMVFQARLLWVATELGYSVNRDTNWLKSCCKSILLPEILAQYIETLGYVDIPNGQRVAPAAYPWEIYERSSQSTRLKRLLHALDQPDDVIPDWGLNPALLTRYAHSSARGTRLGTGFRCVNFDNPQGRRELLVSYKENARGIIPCAPAAITIPEAQLGSIHHWRRIGSEEEWLPAEHHLVHPDFEDTVVNTGLFVCGIMGERHQNSVH